MRADDDPLKWLDSAQCSLERVETNWFYPEIALKQNFKQAQEVCARCEVQEECLSDSIQLSDFLGMRAGFTGAERRAIAKIRQDEALGIEGGTVDVFQYRMRAKKTK